MLLEIARLLAAFLLLVALPGWLLCRALFPRAEDLRPAERATFVLAGGILLLMLVASILGFLPASGGRGQFQSLAMGGMPNVELAMLATLVLLLWAGLQRGAYPGIARRFPILAEPLIKRRPERG